MSEEPPRKRGSATVLIVAIGVAVLLGLLEIAAIQLFGRR